MARLPQPGADDGTWGDILNDFLEVEHNADGTLKQSGSLASKYTKPASGIPKTDFSSSVQDSLSAADTAVQPGSLLLNVKDYGAVGDGVADDTAAIQAAVDAVPANGGTVYLPAGSYKVSAAIELRSYINFIGAGKNASRIIQSSTTAHGIHAADVVSLKIANLRIGGPGGAVGSGCGIYIQTSASPNDYLSIHQVNVRQFGLHGIWVQRTIVSSLIDVMCQNVGGHGFFIDDGTSTDLVACYALSCQQAGYYLNSLAYCSLSGTACDSSGTGYYLDTCQGVSLSGCGCESLVNKSTSYPGHGYVIKGGFANGLYNCVNFVNIAIGVWVTGSSLQNTIVNFDENSPSGATASIQVDTGSRATVISPHVTTATAYNGGVNLLGDGSTSQLVGFGVTPTSHKLDVQHSGNASGLRVTSTTSSGTNTQSIVLARGADTGNRAYGAMLSTDSVTRWTAATDGKLEWGDGTNARDTNLYRPAADSLKTDDSLIVTANAQIGTGTLDIGSGSGVLGLHNATTPPTTNPTNGVIVYSQSGVLKWRDPSGNTYDLSAASSQLPATPLATDQGITAWAYDPLFTTTSTTITNGTVYLAAVRVRSSATVTKVQYIVNTAAATPTTGQNFIGIYNFSGTLLNATAIDSNLGTGLQTVTLSASQALSAGSYWVALVVNAATPPAISRAGAQQLGALNAGLAAASYRFATNGTGQTSLPASITPASNSTTGAIAMWAAVL